MKGGENVKIVKQNENEVVWGHNLQAVGQRTSLRKRNLGRYEERKKLVKVIRKSILETGTAPTESVPHLCRHLS